MLKPCDKWNVPVGTLIYTAQGLVPVEKIKKSHPNATIVTHLGKFIITSIQEIHQPNIYKIKTSLGFVWCGENSKVAVVDKDRYKWKLAKHLIATDKLAQIVEQVEGIDTTINDIYPAPSLTEDIAYFLGHAHGYAKTCVIKKRKGETYVRFKFGKFFDVIKPEKFKMWITMEKNTFTIYSFSFATHMRNIRKTGKVPSYILQAKYSIRKSYIKGFEDSKTIKNNSISITNNRFLYHIQSLYTSLGIRTIACNNLLTKINGTSFLQPVINLISPQSKLFSVDILGVQLSTLLMEAYTLHLKPADSNSLKACGDDGHVSYLVGGGYLMCADSMIAQNPSLRKGTRVLTDTGVKEIQTLENTFFKVKNKNGAWHRARCWKSGINRPLYELTLTNGKKYWCTAEHKWHIGRLVARRKSSVKVPDLPSIAESPGTESPGTESHKSGSSSDHDEDNVQVANISSDDIKSATNDTVEENKVYKQFTVQASGIIKGDILVFECNKELPSGKNNLSFTDGFCIGLLYSSPTLFVIKSDKINTSGKGFRYVWKLSSESVYVNIVREWLSRLDDTHIFIKDITSESSTRSVIISAYSSIIENYIREIGVATPDEVKNSTFGLPSSIWTNSEEFRKGFIDAIFAISGIVQTDSILYISSRSEKFVRDLSDLFGFYGIGSSVKLNIRAKEGHALPPLIAFENTPFYKIFYVTDDNKREQIKNCKQTTIKTNFAIDECVKTNLREDVWDITVYDDTHTFRLSHCFTGNCN
jgi:hypothetical protein